MSGVISLVAKTAAESCFSEQCITVRMISDLSNSDARCFIMWSLISNRFNLFALQLSQRRGIFASY